MNDDIDDFVEAITSSENDPRPGNTVRGVEVAVREPDSEESERKINAKMWAVSGRDYFPAESAVDQLKPGQYVVKHSGTAGVYFSERDINLDDLLVLPDSNSEQVLDHIEEFWEREETFRRYGFLWKRGIMLWGPPGSGKTSTVQQLSKQIVDMGGITVYCLSPSLTSMGLDILRRIEPKRPLVCIFEDIDAIVQEYGESEVLAMLDGELQVDNVVFVATTNYPQRLDKRFINRPSRFDEIIKIGMPSADARRYYLAKKNDRLQNNRDELDMWVNKTEGFSVAHLKELIVSVECFNKPVDVAIGRLRKMMEATVSYYEDNEKRIGFT